MLTIPVALKSFNKVLDIVSLTTIKGTNNMDPFFRRNIGCCVFIHKNWDRFSRAAQCTGMAGLARPGAAAVGARRRRAKLQHSERVCAAGSLRRHWPSLGCLLLDRRYRNAMPCEWLFRSGRVSPPPPCSALEQGGAD